ncbi:DoxD-like family protein [Roseivivax halodurans JCM 10272]|uniref:DoxD-like family protein n=1 Tax=Roseivivax halodurans JCM 10272 TaxID=1449350 RepID=X7EHL7_9RHOB|nr:DoxX family protein [Roseivivax halodurans]ETX14633.1 DoxD-like family protein [Roseivivax halodurans JCM 10272]
MADVAVLVGRALIALLFLAGAAQKAIDPAPAMALLTGLGLPAWPVWPAALFNLAAGLALIAGWRVPVVAALLALYCMVTSVFHLVPSDPWQMSIFVKNWAIAGGCLCLSAHGAGRFSVAALQRGAPPLRSGRMQTGEGNR